MCVRGVSIISLTTACGRANTQTAFEFNPSSTIPANISGHQVMCVHTVIYTCTHMYNSRFPGRSCMYMILQNLGIV